MCFSFSDFFWIEYFWFHFLSTISLLAKVICILFASGSPRIYNIYLYLITLYLQIISYITSKSYNRIVLLSFVLLSYLSCLLSKVWKQLFLLFFPSVLIIYQKTKSYSSYSFVSWSRNSKSSNFEQNSTKLDHVFLMGQCYSQGG